MFKTWEIEELYRGNINGNLGKVKDYFGKFSVNFEEIKNFGYLTDRYRHICATTKEGGQVAIVKNEKKIVII